MGELWISRWAPLHCGSAGSVFYNDNRRGSVLFPKKVKKMLWRRPHFFSRVWEEKTHRAVITKKTPLKSQQNAAMIHALKHRKQKQALVAVYPQMQRFALKLCGNPQDAEDIVQQAYAQALAHLDQFQDGTRLDSWMYRVVQNVFFNRCAQASVAERKRHLLAEPDTVPVSTEQALDANRQLTQVMTVIRQMPEHYRMVLVLVTIEGLSYQEVAQTLQIPMGTVTSRLARARALVVEQCQAANPSPPVKQVH